MAEREKKDENVTLFSLSRRKRGTKERATEISRVINHLALLLIGRAAP